MLLSFIKTFSWVFGGITLCVCLFALVLTIIDYHKTKKALDKKIKQIEKKGEKKDNKKDDNKQEKEETKKDI